MATTSSTSSSTSLHQRSRSLRIPTSHALKSSLQTSSISTSTQQSLSQHGSTDVVPAASGTSHVHTFITNLRLLDLDQSDDWPAITAQTFSTKDSKKRIQSVEWALYHLFLIWNPEETHNKLQPFFPPLEQLQSLNLRAALLRCLEHAKREGALGRDVILRKTMLDECKGERLEEVLSAFSTAVLKKAIQDLETDDILLSTPAVELALANLSYTSTGDRMKLSALTLAHRSSLNRHLKEKKGLDARYRDFENLLKLKERQITRRDEQLKLSVEEHSDETPIPEDIATELQRKVRSNWSGNQDWLETILHGDTRFQTDDFLTSSYDKIWRYVENGSIGEMEYSQRTGLLEELDARVREQNNCLEKWKNYGQMILSRHHSTSISGEGKPKPMIAPENKTSKGIDLGFGAHEALQLGRVRNPLETENQKNSFQPLEEYAMMMEKLKTELADVAKPKRKINFASMARHRKVEDAAEPKGLLDSITPSTSLQHQARESTDSESEVDSVLDDPIYEAASHMGENSSEPTRSSHSSQSPTSTKNKFDHFSSAETAVNTPMKPKATDDEAPSTQSPIESRSTSAHSAMPPPSPPSPPSLPPILTQADQILASMAMATPSPTKPKSRHVLSLAERTRLSMSRASMSASGSALNTRGRRGRITAERDDLSDLDEDDPLPALPMPKPRNNNNTHANPTEPNQLRHVPGNIERKPSFSNDTDNDDEDEGSLPTPSQHALHENQDKHAALIERTRQSLSKNHDQVIKTAHFDRRRSLKLAAQEKRKSYLPPRQEQVLLEEPDDTVDMSLDLEEKRRLIEGDGEVDYESVFKSRPRIKTSPERSPVRRWEEMGGGGGGREGEGSSSPLGY